MSSEPPARYELSGSTAWITVDREAALNALDRATVHGLAEAVERAAGDAAVCAVVLTGAGDRAFIAGADTQELKGRTLVTESRSDGGGRRALAGRLEGLDKPTIAAINGFALGGGLELAMACTLRVASERARLGLPEIELGIIPGNGGTQRLARLVGWGRAMGMVLTGEPIDAPTALAWGLVNRMVAHEQLRAEAQALSDTLAQRPPLAFRAAKEAILASRELGVEAGGHLERRLFAMCCGTADKAEGVRAFLEKRAAWFTGE